MLYYDALKFGVRSMMVGTRVMVAELLTIGVYTVKAGVDCTCAVANMIEEYGKKVEESN